MVNPAVGVNIMVSKIELLDASARIVCRSSSRVATGDVCVEEFLFDSPVDFGVNTAVVTGFDGVEGALPEV